MLAACRLAKNSLSLRRTATRGYFSYPGERHGFAYPDPSQQMRSTTILSVRKDNKVVMIGDGQVSLGNTVCKGNAIKVRRMENDILVGMAGGAADCLTLIELLDGFVKSSGGDLTLACVNFVKAWRTEKLYRQLNAQLCVADKTKSLLISGTGEVLEVEDGVMAIGSGGLYALSGAKALFDIEGLDAETIARKSMKVAAALCVFTNDNFVVEVLDITQE